jgi:signal transduction histidine kinase
MNRQVRSRAEEVLTPVPPPGRQGSDDADLSRLFLVGAGLTLVTAAAVAVFATRTHLAPAQAIDIRRVLDTTTILCGIGVFVLCQATWRQVGDQTALWAGSSALLVSIAVAARPELVGALLGAATPDAATLGAVSAAATALVPVLLAAGLVVGLRRRRIGPAVVGIGAVVAAATLAFVFDRYPEFARNSAVSALTSGDGARSVVAGLTFTGVWLALAVGYTVRGLHRRWLYTWVGLLLFALTLAGLAAGAGEADDVWAVGAGTLEAVGVVIALVGCYLELTRAYEDQSLQLFDSALEVETAEVRERVRDAGMRDQRHDLANAITAIDGAAVILEGELERLSGSDREILARAVASGTARLRRLLDQASAEGSEVSLAETATAVAASPAWPLELELEVIPDVLATGSPGETVEAVRLLVDYASRRAPREAVTLRSERDGKWAVLRVEDRGPTMSREFRRSVLDAESRRVPGFDAALSLRVAARLMKGQGGDLWVEARTGGGTSFGICLPAVTDRSEDGGDDDV